MTTPDVPYKRNAIDPIACIKGGWELVKPNYLLFVGMAFIGYFIGAAVPMGILMGPMMCGLFVSYFAVRRGEPIEFGTLFKGFDFFGPSLVATLLHMIPVAAIIIPTYIVFYASIFAALIAQSQTESPLPTLGVFGVFGIVLLVVFVLIIFISAGFMFAYPLVVDRRLNGLDAVKLSFKAALANFGRLLLMMVLTSAMGMAGMLAGCIGIFFVFPITYAAIAVAYEQVFGLAHASEASNLPPPPPVFT